MPETNEGFCTIEEALAEFKSELEIQPRSSGAYTNVG